VDDRASGFVVLHGRSFGSILAIVAISSSWGQTSMSRMSRARPLPNAVQRLGKPRLHEPQKRRGHVILRHVDVALLAVRMREMDAIPETIHSCRCRSRRCGCRGCVVRFNNLLKRPTLRGRQRREVKIDIDMEAGQASMSFDAHSRQRRAVRTSCRTHAAASGTSTSCHAP